MTNKTDKSNVLQWRRKKRDAADYLYQGAMIAAALLLILSAAV